MKKPCKCKQKRNKIKIFLSLFYCISMTDFPSHILILAKTLYHPGFCFNEGVRFNSSDIMGNQ